MRLSQERKLYAVGAIIGYLGFMFSVVFIVDEIMTHQNISHIVFLAIVGIALYFGGNQLKKGFDSIKVTTIHHSISDSGEGDKQ